MSRLLSVDRALAALIDHTLLRPDALAAEIDRLCEEARAYGFRTVCVQPTFVRRAALALRAAAAPDAGAMESALGADVDVAVDLGAGVGVTAVVAFPHGANATATKVFETRRAIDDGATEIDMVANLGWIRAGTAAGDAALTDEVAAIVAAAAPAGVPVKVILEVALFPDDRKEAAARAALAAGAAFVKTSTGYASGGATVEDVALLRRVVGEAAGVKASGGIKTRAQALALVAAGANRIGASGSIDLVRMATP